MIYLVKPGKLSSKNPACFSKKIKQHSKTNPMALLLHHQFFITHNIINPHLQHILACR